MPYLLARHRVRDFDQWKRVFDEETRRQRDVGMRVLHVFRDPADAGAATFLMEVEDRARAEAFMSRPGSEQIAEEAGAQPPFDVHWLEPA